MRYLFGSILILFFSICTSSITLWQAADTPQDGGQVQEVVVSWKQRCRGIKLNTNFPFIWDCIVTYNSKTDENWDKIVTPVDAFPKLIWALMNLLMTVILIMSLLMIVYSWVLMTTGWYSTNNYTKGLWMLFHVAKWMALLWASWVILKVINPNFFV